jgi:exosortase/archaeosortase family protein
MAGSTTVVRQGKASAGRFTAALGQLTALINQTSYWPVLALTLGAVCVDSWLVPDLNTVAPAFSCGLLLLLALRSSPGNHPLSTREPTPPVPAWRICCFLVLHLALIGGGVALGGLWRGPHSAGLSISLAASKYLILAPTAFLLPGAAWRLFGRLYRAEWIASAIALASFFPLRIFTMAWPWYGQALGRSVFALARLFVPGTQYVPALTPALVGPHLEVTIVFGCGGLQGIKLFQMLFALVLVVDWNDLNRRRALAAYFGGLAAMLIANVIRITLLFVLGNTSLENHVLEYHLTGGWILFTLAFIAYLLATYRWMLSKPAA